jgi:hypothetical protein
VREPPLEELWRGLFDDFEALARGNPGLGRTICDRHHGETHYRR